jgi:hypothetical protein
VAVAAVLASASLSACGGGGEGAERSPLGAESTCSDFLNAAEEERARALRLLAAELGVPEAVTPVGSTQVDYTCAQEPDGALGDAVQASAGEAAASSPADGVLFADPQAQEAAENGLRLALTYSWNSLAEDMAAAQSVMTPGYWQEAKQTWDVVIANAADNRTTMEVSVLASGVVKQEAAEATFLVFINRPMTNNTDPEPVVYEDAVLVTVTSEGDGNWLVDDIKTSALEGSTDALAEGPGGAAERFVAAVNTFSRSDLDADGEVGGYNARIRPLLTADFFNTYLDSEEALVGLLESGVESSFEPMAVAVSESDGDSATALVAGRTLRTADGTEGEPELQRVEVDLVNEDGEWLVRDFATVES